jgi:hypothetical protein
MTENCKVPLVKPSTPERDWMADVFWYGTSVTVASVTVIVPCHTCTNSVAPETRAEKNDSATNSLIEPPPQYICPAESLKATEEFSVLEQMAPVKMIV